MGDFAAHDGIFRSKITSGKKREGRSEAAATNTAVMACFSGLMPV